MYSDNNEEIDNFYCDFCIKDDKITKLITSKEDNYIRIYDFHKGYLIDKIVVKNNVVGLCFLENDIIIAGCVNNMLLVDTKNKIILKGLVGHENAPRIIKKIDDKFGEFLISGCFNKIIIWKITCEMLEYINEIKYSNIFI